MSKVAKAPAHAAKKEPVNDKLDNLIAISSRSAEECKEALRICSGNVQRAAELLTDPEKNIHLWQSSATKRATKKEAPAANSSARPRQFNDRKDGDRPPRRDGPPGAGRGDGPRRDRDGPKPDRDGAKKPAAAPAAAATAAPAAPAGPVHVIGGARPASTSTPWNIAAAPRPPARQEAPAAEAAPSLPRAARKQAQASPPPSPQRAAVAAASSPAAAETQAVPAAAPVQEAVAPAAPAAAEHAAYETPVAAAPTAPAAPIAVAAPAPAAPASPAAADNDLGAWDSWNDRAGLQLQGAEIDYLAMSAGAAQAAPAVEHHAPFVRAPRAVIFSTRDGVPKEDGFVLCAAPPAVDAAAPAPHAAVAQQHMMPQVPHVPHHGYYQGGWPGHDSWPAYPRDDFAYGADYSAEYSRPRPPYAKDGGHMGHPHGMRPDAAGRKGGRGRGGYERPFYPPYGNQQWGGGYDYPQYGGYPQGDTWGEDRSRPAGKQQQQQQQHPQMAPNYYNSH